MAPLNRIFQVSISLQRPRMRLCRPWLSLLADKHHRDYRHGHQDWKADAGSTALSVAGFLPVPRRGGSAAHLRTALPADGRRSSGHLRPSGPGCLSAGPTAHTARSGRDDSWRSGRDRAPRDAGRRPLLDMGHGAGQGRTARGRLTICPEFRDHDIVYHDAWTASSMGFDGKFAIHPSQVEPIHRAFAPSDIDVAQARQIVDAYDQAVTGGNAAVAVDGKMIDPPVAERARALLSRAGRR